MTRHLWPPRPVHDLADLSDAERLASFDALHTALAQAGPHAHARLTHTPDGLCWIIDQPASVLTTGQRHDPLIQRLRDPMRRATHIDILAAFVMHSGVSLIAPLLRDALQRGAAIRVLTGDYLAITHAHALRWLLDLAREAAPGDDDAQPGYPGSLALHVIEQTALHAIATTFHPKAWLIRTPDHHVAFVGSSNLSRAALLDGLEWNLGVDSASDPAGFDRIARAYDALWSLGQPPSNAWLDAYQLRQQDRAKPLASPLITPDDDPTVDEAPAPRPAQQAALDALTASRARGHQRALVVMATGMGKTWLAAFDVQRLIAERGLTQPRVLLIAHRVELLRQAQRTFRVLFPDWQISWLAADQADTSGDLVLASVQKLQRAPHLPRFDYVILDEVHHALAPRYAQIISTLQAGFILGLTATPERMDGQDLRELFSYNVPFESTLKDGIHQGALCALRYHGVADTIDYAPLPWRGGRFDMAALEAAAISSTRMDTLWRALAQHPGSRTLLFCCTIPHARFVARWLTQQGWRVACAHSAPDSDDRSLALSQLENGEIDAISVVDLFNEGIDIPAVDRVVMLRPTESPVIFLQQLGRGLRTWPGKAHLEVIDLVGNHRVFIDRLRLLCEALGQGAHTLRAVMEGRADRDAGLPDGSIIELELAAVPLLQTLWPSASELAVVRAYRALDASRSARPLAAELVARGYNPLALRSRGGWLQFVADEGGLDMLAQEALASHRAWLERLEAWRWRDVHATLALSAWRRDAAAGAWRAGAAAAAPAAPAAAPALHAQLALADELIDALLAALSGEHVEAAVEAQARGAEIALDRALALPELIARLEPGGQVWWLGLDGARVADAREIGGAGRGLTALREATGEAWRLERSPDGWWVRAGTAQAEASAVMASGRSHALEEVWQEAAKEATAWLWAQRGKQTVSVDGKRFVLVERLSSGSMRLQPEGAKGTRTVTVTDLGWALAAAQRAGERGEEADEAEVNRLRYAPGTPRAATRWIDTGWALRLIKLMETT